MIPIKDLVKNNKVKFSRYRKGFLYYTIAHRLDDSGFDFTNEDIYEFPVPIEDCGDATFPDSEKAIMFMRYIRKAQQDGEFVKVSV